MNYILNFQINLEAVNEINNYDWQNTQLLQC